MKKTKTILFSALLLSASSAMADSYITASNVSIMPDGTAEMVLTANYTNSESSEAGAWQFTFTLPEGISVATDDSQTTPAWANSFSGWDKTNDKYVRELSTEVNPDGFFLMVQKVAGSTNTYQAIAFQTDVATKKTVETLKSNNGVVSGKLGTITLKADASFAGHKGFTISDVKIAEVSNEVFTGDMVSLKVIRQGDVNGDGKLGVADYTSIVDWETGNVGTLLFEAVDVNKDNKIGVADYTKLVEIEAGYAARAKGVFNE